MDSQLKAHLETRLSEIPKADCCNSRATAATGGCIHQTWHLETEQGRFFVKTNQLQTLETFQAEAEALREISQTQIIRVPHSIVVGHFEQTAYLILEGLPLSNRQANWQQLGSQLADMHRHTTEEYGWHRDNHIGSTPQNNSYCENWADFFCQHRLAPQFQLAKNNGHQFEQVGALLSRAHQILENHQPEASLLHGDLWSGNVSFLENGTPVIYDPATYYGDRETDIAFTEFFGGFAPEFYTSYHRAWPLPDGYEQRKELYNLYHVLNHVNLFGGSYTAQATRIITNLLAIG